MEIDLDSIMIIKQIGCGNFGEVYLVQDEDVKNLGLEEQESLYAVKAISNNVTEEERSLNIIVQREKNILKMVRHPFIQEFKDFKLDSDNFYLFTKFYEGMDLHTFLLENSTHFSLCLLYRIRARPQNGEVLHLVDYSHAGVSSQRVNRV